MLNLANLHIDVVIGDCDDDVVSFMTAMRVSVSENAAGVRVAVFTGQPIALPQDMSLVAARWMPSIIEVKAQGRAMSDVCREGYNEKY